MKRGRKGDQLTGGTGDVNPQEFVFPLLTQTAADTPTIKSIPLPIPRYPQQSGKQIVIELLWVQFNFIVLGAAAAAQNLYMGLTTNPTVPANITTALLDPRVLANYLTAYLFAAGGSFEVPVEHEVDLTDNAGHGVLVATDNLYGTILSTGTNAANNGVIRFGYRFKEVALSEYIGIVQSQQ